MRFSPMRFASVIPTGAPRKFGPFKKSLARSGGTPREFPPPCRLKASSQDCQWQQFASKEERVISSNPTRRREQRPPVSGTMHGENCLLQHDQGRSIGIPPLRAIGLLMGTRSPWRSGRDDSFNIFRKKITDQGRRPWPLDKDFSAGKRMWAPV